MSGSSRRWLDVRVRKQRDSLVIKLNERGLTLKHIGIRVSLSTVRVKQIIDEEASSSK